MTRSRFIKNFSSRLKGGMHSEEKSDHVPNPGVQRLKVRQQPTILQTGGGPSAKSAGLGLKPRTGTVRKPTCFLKPHWTDHGSTPRRSSSNPRLPCRTAPHRVPRGHHGLGTHPTSAVRQPEMGRRTCLRVRTLNRLRPFRKPQAVRLDRGDRQIRHDPHSRPTSKSAF